MPRNNDDVFKPCHALEFGFARSSTRVLCQQGVHDDMKYDIDGEYR